MFSPIVGHCLCTVVIWVSFSINLGLPCVKYKISFLDFKEALFFLLFFLRSVFIVQKSPFHKVSESRGGSPGLTLIRRSSRRTTVCLLWDKWWCYLSTVFQLQHLDLGRRNKTLRNISLCKVRPRYFSPMKSLSKVAIWGGNNCSSDP